LSALRGSGDRPVVTWSIVVLCVLVYILQIIPGSEVTSALLYYPPLTALEPWRMITSIFVHSPGSVLHIVFNMFSLVIFGPILEQALGRVRFLALFLMSGLGGSVAVLLLAPQTPVLGASGAIFGLLGAFFVIQRRLGGTNVQLLLVIVLNLAVGFLPGTNIAWQAHVGGLIVGALVGLIFLYSPRGNTNRMSNATVQAALVGGLFILLMVTSAVRMLV